MFCSIEISDRPFYASPIGIYDPLVESQADLSRSNSDMSDASVWSTSSSEWEKSHSQRAWSARISDREFWLQRQNSLSSRNAIYPPSISYPTRPAAFGTLSTPMPGSRRYWSHSLSHRSMASPSTRMPLPSVLENFDSISFPARASLSNSSTSSMSRRSPLSTMHRVSQPEVPIILNRFHNDTSRKASRRHSGLQLAWPPSIHHAPLSADPAIRAFSIGSELEENGPDHRQAQGLIRNASPLSTSKALLVPEVGYLPSILGQPPFPKRAYGHMIPQELGKTTPQRVTPLKQPSSIQRKQRDLLPVESKRPP